MAEGVKTATDCILGTRTGSLIFAQWDQSLSHIGTRNQRAAVFIARHLSSCKIGFWGAGKIQGGSQ
jgi:hypothetical protein